MGHSSLVRQPVISVNSDSAAEIAAFYARSQVKRAAGPAQLNTLTERKVVTGTERNPDLFHTAERVDQLWCAQWSGALLQTEAEFRVSNFRSGLPLRARGTRRGTDRAREKAGRAERFAGHSLHGRPSHIFYGGPQ